MPFKSEAQRRKMYELFKKGDITREQYESMAKDTPTTIPERAPGKNNVVIRRPRRLAK